MPSDSNEGLSTALREASVHHESSKEIEDPDGDDFHGDCKDSSSSGFYDDHLEAYTSCHEMRHQCSHPTLGKSIRQMCPRSCHECVPQMWPVMSSSCVLCEELVEDAWQVQDEEHLTRAA